METLIKNIPDNEINLVILVLTASQIAHHVTKTDGLWEIRVEESQKVMAQNVLYKFFEENKHFGQPFPQAPFNYRKTYMALWVCLILGLVHVYINMNHVNHKAVDRFGASASDIMNGEIYRATTALFLHSNYVHISGNILGIAVAGTFVWSLFGWGVGSFFILLSGILGNLLTAYMYQSGHVSIGASTCVFGALGILTGKSIVDASHRSTRFFRRLLPVGASLALLGLFSAGENTDILAHLFGYLFGMAIGTLYAFNISAPMSQKNQARFLALSVFMILMAVIRSFRTFPQ